MAKYIIRPRYLQQLIDRRDNGDDIATYTDNNGIVFMGLIQFLLNDDILK